MAQFVAFFAGLVMGTGSTLTIKIAYSLNGTDSQGVERPFEKPLSTTFVMFVAMFCSLPIYFITRCYTRYCTAPTTTTKEEEHQHPINSPLLSHTTSSSTTSSSTADTTPPPVQQPGLSTRLFFLLLVPALFDLLGTALAKVGLMYCDVSTYQLIRCTVIVFTAIAKQLTGQRLPKHVWAGVVLITTAMIFVSASSLIEAADDTTVAATSGLKKDPKVGILFLMCSCVVASMQYVFEEKVMSEDGAHPLIVVGMEGFWGCFLFVTTVFPWAYIIPGNDVGSLENVHDSWVMVQSSKGLQYSLFGFFITVALYNIMAVYLTHMMSAVWHAVLDCFRPVSVWGTDLLIFYVISNGTFGEPWTNWSYLEAAGMLVLFFGTAVFNGNVVLSCCPPEEEEEEEDVVLNPYKGDDPDDPTTPLYFVNGDMFHTPQTRTQPKPPLGSGGRRPRSSSGRQGRQHSTGAYCRSPLLSRSAARRAYRERTVVGFSQWANSGGSTSSSHVVTSGGPAPLTVRILPSSDPSAISSLHRSWQEEGGEEEDTHSRNTKKSGRREFGRDVSNDQRRQ